MRESTPNEFQSMVDTLTDWLEKYGEDEIQAALEFTLTHYSEDKEVTP